MFLSFFIHFNSDETMKKIIEYHYNIYIDELNNKAQYFMFDYNSEKYFFVPLNRSIEDLDDIMLVNNEMKNKGLITHDIILNKENKILTKTNEANYILLKLNGNLKDKYDIFDIMDNNEKLIVSPTKSKLYRNDWANLWSAKIDYFEYQIRELGKNKRIVIDSFSYYIGLAENAISYVNKTTSTIPKMAEDKITLSRKRIHYPNYRLSYMNPINLIFDLEVRDIAEYTKSAFFNGGSAFEELKEFLKRKKLSRFGYQMLFGRLLYPSYYFDLFESIMEKEEKEEKILKIIEKTQDYELFLCNIYYLISKYSMIEPVEWITRQFKDQH